MEQQQQPVVATKWQDGICDCFNDSGICAQSTFCNICTASSIYYREESTTAAATSCDCESCCILWCLSGCREYTCLPVNGCLTQFLSAGLRRTLMQRYGIEGESLCASCLLGLFCNVCTMCQVQREMKARGQNVGGICASTDGPADALPADPPQQQRGMVHDPAEKPLLQREPVTGTATGTAEWGSGPLDCAGAPDCCEAFWCWCSVVGHMGRKVNAIRGVDGATESEFDHASCFGSVWVRAVYTYLLRRELVERYAITSESIVQSCLCAVFCTPCALAQSRREMGLRGEYPGGLWMKDMPPMNAAEAAAVQ